MLMLNFSSRTREKIRSESVGWVAPSIEKLLSIKHAILHPTTPSPFFHMTEKEQNERLTLENHLYRAEIMTLQKELKEQAFVISQMSQKNEAKSELSPLSECIENSLLQRLKAVPARVIFRSLDTWNHVLWINAGKNSINSVVINSPVVIGQAIVGVVDLVGETQSRVRLLSDPRLNPSVRVARGGEVDLVFAEYIERVIQEINFRRMDTSDGSLSLIGQLRNLQKQLQPKNKNVYLAKGELRGCVYPSRIGEEVILKGTGFNFDFSDVEGKKRDLRTGKILGQMNDKGMPLIKPHDVLVTTGMDGVFPAGFQVASVLNVKSLNEGDYFFDIEAKPIVGDLEELSLVFVLPPLKTQNSD